MIHKHFALGLLLALGVSCNGETEEKGASQKKETKGSGSDGSDGSEGSEGKASDASGSGKGSAASGSDAGKASGKGPGSGASGSEAEAEEEEEEGDGGAEEAIKKLLADCGGGDAAKAGPDDVIYERSVTSLPIVKNILIAQIVATTKLDVRVTGAKTEQTSTVTIGALEADFLKKLAEKSAAENSGKVTLTNVPISKYSELSKDKIYDGVICTFVPATAIENTRGGKKTIASFDPPVPTAISPRAVAERYEAEIGKGRTFDGIKVTVKESDHPALKGKKELTGKVTVAKVESTRSVDDGKGGKVDVKGDAAFEMSFDFEGPAVTYALGLPPKVTFFIDHEKHDLAANVVDTAGIENGGTAVFIYSP